VWPQDLKRVVMLIPDNPVNLLRGNGCRHSV
jgi:hypothetical protein